MPKKSKTAESITLAELATRYIAKLEQDGKSAGTTFSYLMELKLAQAELGVETLLSALSPAAIAAFNASERVTMLKSGRSKSPLSIDKTRRVLRQALAWAHENGLITEPLVDPRKDALPGEPVHTPDVTVVANGVIVTEGAPAKKPRGRKRALTLEVSQAEADAAADAAEHSA